MDEIVLMNNGMVVFNEDTSCLAGIRKVCCKAKDIKAGNAIRIVEQAQRIRGI